MKKTLLIILVLILLGYFSVVKRVTVNAEEEAVLIKKPWFMTKSGVEDKAVQTGTVWAVNSTEVKLMNLSPFDLNASFSELLTADNIPISFNLSLKFQYQKTKTPQLIKKFGEKNEWYKTLLLPALNVAIEVNIKNNHFQDLQANNQHVQLIEESIQSKVQTFLTAQQVPVNIINVHINKITPPQKIIDAAIRTKVEEEKVKKLKRQIEVQKLRKKNEEAQAASDKAYMKKMNLSISQFLRLKKIELEETRLQNQRYAIESAKEYNSSIRVQLNIGKH